MPLHNAATPGGSETHPYAKAVPAAHLAL